MSSDESEARVLVRAEALGFSHPGVAVLQSLSFALRPGLSLVRGGGGRGKTTLLRLLSGSLAPTAGLLQTRAETVFHADMADPAHDPVVARAWIESRRSRCPNWNSGVVGRLIDGFGLADHIDKPLYMLSTGSRRKVGLLAAAASSAQLTLLDTPFAALDGPSRQVLGHLLTAAADSAENAWVVADCELPSLLAGVRLAARVDLGD